MQNKKLPIRKIVSYLNDDEAEGGGFWLPNIQRPFVWSEDQIARLFDSIMREYPISTLLVWKTKEAVKHRKFIDNYRRDIKLTDFYVPDHSRSKMMVLDGQQRLQSLFVGLRGSYEGRELYFDVLSGGAAAAPEDIRFRFAFKAANTGWPWVRLKNIVFETKKLDSQIAKDIIRSAPIALSEDQKDMIELNVGKARQEFVNDDNITFQELDGIDNPDAYRLDDIVEIFIRANSGGTKLGKSDLLFSLLTSSWDEADGEMEVLLEDLNQGGFDFDRDFVLKSCLTILGKGARYEVGKFRDGKTKEEIIAKWGKLAEAIKAVRDLLVSKTYIRSDRAMPSYLALIPLIYYRFHYPAKFAANRDMATYLLRVLVTGVFGGSPDNLIDKLVRNIHEKQDFVLSEIYGVIRAEGRNLEITPAVIFDQCYGSRAIHLFFNLWYQDFDYSPALDANGPQVDHIFPQSLLKTVKDINSESGKRNILHYRAEQRDQIANCMLLTAEENGFSRKSDTPPAQWFARDRFGSDEVHQRYLAMHLIPNDPALWELDRFDDFIEMRKALIEKKFSYMLQPAEGSVA
ncbi:MAG: GmrSD restriction endonuclease domain-containing protein [Lysobacterales bacterium]